MVCLVASSAVVNEKECVLCTLHTRHQLPEEETIDQVSHRTLSPSVATTLFIM